MAETRGDELMESERIKHDIDRTRAQMSGTIDEIQERLTPSRLLHDATASVREATMDSARRVFRQAERTAGRTAGHARAASARAAGYAKAHPLPVALVLCGVALVLARAIVGRRREAPLESSPDWDDVPRGGRERVNDVHVRREYQDWAEPASGARSTAASVSSWIAENPLAIGAAVAAAGTVAGLRWANQPGPVQGIDSVRR